MTCSHYCVAYMNIWPTDCQFLLSFLSSFGRSCKARTLPSTGCMLLYCSTFRGGICKTVSLNLDSSEPKLCSPCLLSLLLVEGCRPSVGLQPDNLFVPSIYDSMSNEKLAGFCWLPPVPTSYIAWLLVQLWLQIVIFQGYSCLSTLIHFSIITWFVSSAIVLASKRTVHFYVILNICHSQKLIVNY